MSYRVRIESFEGPFDLLLYLVSRQKVDIGSISISEIADQYLAEIDRMRSVDLDVASDFLLVAATLLEMKAASLVPDDEESVVDEDVDELSPSQMRDLLVGRLVEYKKFKNAAGMLKSRFESEGRMHGRPFGPDRSLLTLVPDYLQGTTVEDLGKLCAACFAKRDVFLLESEHIARRVIPLEERVRNIHTMVKTQGHTRFSQLVERGADSATIVVTFLALLELFKRRQVSLTQDELFGDIDVTYLEDADETALDGDYDSAK